MNNKQESYSIEQMTPTETEFANKHGFTQDEFLKLKDDNPVFYRYIIKRIEYIPKEDTAKKEQILSLAANLFKIALDAPKNEFFGDYSPLDARITEHAGGEEVIKQIFNLPKKSV